MNVKDLQKQIVKMRIAKLNALGSPGPYNPEEAMQDSIVPVGKPQHETKDDKKHPEQEPIVHKEMMDEYAEGLNKHSNRLDLQENRTKIDDTQEPIEGISKSKVYLNEGEKAPESSPEKRGPRGGRYYETSGAAPTPKAEQPKIAGKLEVNYNKEMNDLDSTLSAIMKGAPEFEPLSGTFEPHTISTLKDNADKYLEQFDRFVDATTFNKMRSSIYKIISDGTKIKGKFSPEDLQSLAQDSVNKLMYQEVNAWERQLSDHGVRHISGNINTADRIVKAMNHSGLSVTDEERLMIDIVMINHDIGYTTEKVRVSIPETQNHPAYSKSWFDNERSFFTKFFSDEQLDAMSDYIEHHDQIDIDWENKKLLSIISVSDNLSIFHEDKLPSLFKYVDGSLDILFNMQKALRDKDEDTFNKERLNLVRAINQTGLPPYTKSWLVKAAKEVSIYTPKFTIPMLIGRVEGFDYNIDDGLIVDIQEDMFDTRVADFYDMGQKAYTKLAEAYHTDLANNDKIKFMKGAKQLMQINISREKVEKSLDIMSIDILKAEGEPKGGLMPKKIVVHMKDGTTYTRTQMVRDRGLPAVSLGNEQYAEFLVIPHNSLIEYSRKKTSLKKVQAMADIIDADREKKMDKEYIHQAYDMIDGWAEGALYKITGLRMLAAEIRGKEISDDKWKMVWKGVTGNEPTDKQIEQLKGMAAIGTMSIDKNMELDSERPKKILQSEMNYAKQRTKELFGDKITVYRGIYGGVAKEIREKLERGGEVELEDLPLSSYTQDPIAALGFVVDKPEYIIIKREINADDVAFAWYSNPALLFYLPAQKEVVVDPKENKFKVSFKDINIW